MKIAIFPGAKYLSDGKLSAKYYPAWGKIIGCLQLLGHEVHQFGVPGDENLLCDKTVFTTNPLDVEKALGDYDLFIATDTWIQHMANYIDCKTPGIVLWSLSDPAIFGYKWFVNLAKPEYFRKDQHAVWIGVEPVNDAFADFKTVLDTVKRIMEASNED